MRFTGGDNLTGFKKLINNVFMKNELLNGEGAYEISYAKVGRSGYSFGPVQWDLLTRNSSWTLFTDILMKARDSDSNLIFDLDKNGSIEGDEIIAISNIMNIVETNGRREMGSKLNYTL